MIRRYLAAAVFAACMICAPIFTEAIASPNSDNAIYTNTALPAALPADNIVAATPVRFCTVTRRSSTETTKAMIADTITSERFHIRC